MITMTSVIVSEMDTIGNERIMCNFGERKRNSSSVSESSDCAVFSNEDFDGKSSSSKNRRKTSRPQRSATSLRNDPLFRGMTFWMSGPTKDTQLRITSFFSVQKKDRHPSGGWPRKKHASVGLDDESSSSESEQERPPAIPFHHVHRAFIHGLGKTCASCGTRRTPLWRDAEDGTPLCNACGIRYKKYRVRCVHCWHIPKKDGKSYPNCARCGDTLRMTLPRRVQFF